MKAWRQWIGLLALWVAPTWGHAMSVSIAPEAGVYQDEAGRRSSIADATTFAVAARIPTGSRLLLRPSVELELASQTFARNLPAARTLAILDQRGAGLGLGVDLALPHSRAWRTEASLVFGENQARTAATYTTLQEETSYRAPYGRALIASGFVMPVSGPLSFGIMGGWRETRFDKPRGELEITGTQAKRPGGLLLTYDRASLESRHALRAPASLSGWFIRLGIEAGL